MSPFRFQAHGLVALAIASMFLAGPSLADDDHGNGKGNKHGDKHADKEERKADKEERKREQKADKHRDREDVRVGQYFNDNQREAVRGYYHQQYGDGRRCPPGLAKKNNGCMPPGQARKWAVGQPLPSSVVYYPVPSAVTVQLGAPPAGHKYVRVAGDILLIAIGTSMIVDAVTDLGRI